MLFLIGATPLAADWRDEIGFTRLKLLAGAELPTAPSQGFTQVEALDEFGNFESNTTLFPGKTFSHLSGASGISNHAQHVATNFYGNTSSLITGNCPVGLYNVNSWVNSGFLKTSSFSSPATESHAVQNHSWVGTLSASFTAATAAEINRRLDFAINRDGFVCVVGSDNSGSSVLPAIAPDFALVRDSAQSAAITIQDKPFDTWRFANFSNSGLSNPAISSETADPDGDHLANLLEYALALHPKQVSISPVTTGQSGGYLTIASSKNTATTDISWTAEVTADLTTWQSLLPTLNTASNFAANDIVRSDEAAQRFIRLKITRP